MNFENYTNKSQEVIGSSQKQALDMSHHVIEPLHLLYAILTQKESMAMSIFSKIEISLNSIVETINMTLKQLPTVSGGEKQSPLLSNDSVRVFFGAETIAKDMKDSFISVEHILLSLIVTII